MLLSIPCQTSVFSDLQNMSRHLTNTSELTSFRFVYRYRSTPANSTSYRMCYHRNTSADLCQYFHHRKIRSNHFNRTTRGSLILNHIETAARGILVSFHAARSTEGILLPVCIDITTGLNKDQATLTYLPEGFSYKDTSTYLPEESQFKDTLT